MPPLLTFTFRHSSSRDMPYILRLAKRGEYTEEALGGKAILYQSVFDVAHPLQLAPAIESIIRQAHTLDASAYVFSKNGKPLAYSAAIMAFRRVSAKVGYPVSAHRFRHSHGTHRVEAGDNLKNIQDSLGHADIRTTTKFYVDLPLAAQRDGLQRLPIEDLLTIPAIAKTVRGR